MKKEILKEKLEALLKYMNFSKGVGHTSAVLNGAIETNAVVLVEKSSDALNLGLKYNVSSMSWEKIREVINSNIEKNEKFPLIVDNSALIKIISDMLEVIEELKHEDELDTSTIYCMNTYFSEVTPEHIHCNLEKGHSGDHAYITRKVGKAGKILFSWIA